MKRQAYIIIIATVIVGFGMAFAQDKSDVMRKTDDGTYIVNTTTLCNTRGYRQGTPVEVYIKKGKVVKVEALKNRETKNFFALVVKNLLPMYNDLKLSKAKKLTEEKMVDGCTGATYSCNAVQDNIKAALEYYEANK